MFLNRASAARRRSEPRRHGVAPIVVNCSHGVSVWILLPLGLPITVVAATPGELPSLRWSGPGGTLPHRRIHSPFRLSLIGSRYPFGRVGREGRRGTFTGQCCQPLCAGDATKHLNGPGAVTESRHLGIPFQGFSKFRNLASRSGRNVTPPALSSLGPFDAARCQATLATYPPVGVRVRISKQARTRSGRIRFHPVPPSKIAPFLK